MNLLDAIGSKPLVKIEGIWVKLEYQNPSGSVKDRIAKYIVEQAERTGRLKKGGTIIEATSGNTGIAFSLVASLKGYRMIAVMPKGLSEERMEIMKAYGTEVIHPKHNCFHCAIELTHKYEKKKGFYLPRQFENEWNIEENQEILGQEILRDMDNVDAFVAGVGTGGTVIGVGKALKKSNPDVHIVALEPSECAIMTQCGIGKLRHKTSKTCRKHGIEGIGDGILPDIVKRNRKVIDDVVRIDTKHAIAEAQRLAKLGYLVGPSSGANFLAAKQLRKRFKTVVTLFPDSGDRYLSEGIFD